MATVKKDQLFKKRLGEEDVEVPNVGTVRVRALTRKEVLGLGLMPGQEAEMDLADAERKVISSAMIDPKLTQDEVGEWQDASPADELNVVFTAVLRLSGLTAQGGKEVVKEAMQRFPE